MELMRPGDVPVGGGVNDRLYRYAPRVVVVWVSALLVACIVLVATPQGRRVWVAYYLAAVTVAGLFMFRRYIRARFLPSNWLVRMTDRGVFIQLRSYLNWHFPNDDLTVAFVPFSEIESVGLIRERRTVLQTDDDVVVRRRKLVEFKLRADTRAVARVLADELLDRLSRSEQEDRLLELASTGEDIEATALARRLYGYSLTEARKFIASLQGGKRRAAGDAR